VGPLRTEAATLNLRRELPWLSIMAAVTAIEAAYWALCARAGIAPMPRVATYVALAGGGMMLAFLLRLIFARRKERASWTAVAMGTVLVGLGASFFLPLKYAIPALVPFWLDRPLAAGERYVFGADAWRIADALFGWALVPIDRVYGTWLPVQSVVLFSVVLLPPSVQKSRAIIAYVLAWFLLGVVAAVLLASAGPVFYDRLLGGDQFAALTKRLSAGAWITRTESDAMWASFENQRPGMVLGMSAMPSIHVAIAVWMWLAARSLWRAAAPAAASYAIFIWIGSVQLGWHYASDGLAGALGMLAVWWITQTLTSGPAFVEYGSSRTTRGGLSIICLHGHSH